MAFLTLLAFVTDVGASIHSASGNGRTLGKSSTLRLPRAASSMMDFRRQTYRLDEYSESLSPPRPPW